MYNVNCFICPKIIVDISLIHLRCILFYSMVLKFSKTIPTTIPSIRVCNHNEGGPLPLFSSFVVVVIRVFHRYRCSRHATTSISKTKVACGGIPADVSKLSCPEDSSAFTPGLKPLGSICCVGSASDGGDLQCTSQYHEPQVQHPVSLYLPHSHAGYRFVPAFDHLGGMKPCRTRQF